MLYILWKIYSLTKIIKQNNIISINNVYSKYSFKIIHWNKFSYV